MKKLSLGLFLALAAAVVWPAVGLALTQGTMKPLADAALGTARPRYSLPAGLLAASDLTRVQAHPRGLLVAARAASGPCTVTGHLLGYSSGDPLVGSEVDLYYWDGSGVEQFVGWTDTDATGAFTFTGVPATSAGEIYAWPSDGPDEFYSVNDTFSAAGPNDFTLRPGMTGATVIQGSDAFWQGWTSFALETWGSGGGYTIVGGASGLGYVMAPDYDYAIAYPWPSQGIELNTVAQPVIPGANDGLTMTFDQANGRGAWIGGWASGRPGSVATFVLDNWPTDYRAAFYGYSEANPAKEKDWSFSAGSNGWKDAWLNLTIPSTATPGYDYEVHAFRCDDPASDLDLTTYFQVATLNASHTTLRRGGALRLSGIVPVDGHPGKAKSVILYQRNGAAGQPTVWNAGAKGWHKVGTFRANGWGKFTTRLLRPQRTTWYILRYPGDQYHWRAYTSVRKVVVKN